MEKLFAIFHIVYKEQKKMKSINLSSNSINYTSSNSITSILSENTNLEYLNLSNCNVDHAGLDKILSALVKVSTLKYLLLASNSFTNAMTTKVKMILENDKFEAHRFI